MQKFILIFTTFTLLIGCASDVNKAVTTDEQIVISYTVDSNQQPEPEPEPKKEEPPAPDPNAEPTIEWCKVEGEELTYILYKNEADKRYKLVETKYVTYLKPLIKKLAVRKRSIELDQKAASDISGCFDDGMDYIKEKLGNLISSSGVSVSENLPTFKKISDNQGLEYEYAPIKLGGITSYLFRSHYGEGAIRVHLIRAEEEPLTQSLNISLLVVEINNGHKDIVVFHQGDLKSIGEDGWTKLCPLGFFMHNASTYKKPDFEAMKREREKAEQEKKQKQQQSEAEGPKQKPEEEHMEGGCEDGHHEEVMENLVLETKGLDGLPRVKINVPKEDPRKAFEYTLKDIFSQAKKIVKNINVDETQIFEGYALLSTSSLKNLQLKRK